MLDMAVEVSTEHQSVLDHLGRSRAFLEALIDFGTAVSEVGSLYPNSNVLLNFLQVGSHCKGGPRLRERCLWSMFKKLQLFTAADSHCPHFPQQRLQELERWDRMVLDLAEKMARTLGYIEDVEQFARLVQLKKAIEDIRPLMEDTSTFILEFSTRGTGGILSFVPLVFLP